jgi:8-oxo-dGTP pyrophosphatase MutT (NUDIX family)
MSTRATVLIVADEQILMMARQRNGRSYYTTIGGGIEPGETPQMAARREAKEETNLEVVLGPLLWQTFHDRFELAEHAFLVTQFSGELRLGVGPEAAAQSVDNVYRLEWVPLTAVTHLPDVYPYPPDVARIRQFLTAAK